MAEYQPQVSLNCQASALPFSTPASMPSILTSRPQDSRRLLISCTKKGYDVLPGTSMATPFVAGMAALLWEKYPNVTGDAIWKKLVAGARALDLRTSDAGAGIIFTP